MGVFKRLSQRPLSPATAIAAATAYAVFFGVFTWGSFSTGHTGQGIALAAIFAGTPAVAFATIRYRRRAGIPPKPRTPLQRLRTIVRLALAAVAILGVFTVINVKPAERLPGGIVFGVCLAVLALMTIPRR